MNHVFELFINLKTKNKRHEEIFGVAILFVKKLQLENLSHIVCSPSLFWILCKQGMVSSNFTLKNLCTWDELIKWLNPKQKGKLCTILNYQPP
jgi:hypothetical protein